MGSTPLDFLIATQHTSGGWGYAPGFNPTVEATSAVLLALRSESVAVEAYQRGLEWLRQGQNPDGGWGYSLGDSESNWATAWALLALKKADGFEDEIHRGVKWLLEVKPSPYARENLDFLNQPISKDDPIQNSWPWQPGELTWIEPTAYTILALKDLSVDAATKLRMDAGISYFQRQRCLQGGWTVGDPLMFESALPAHVHTTAVVLMAMMAYSPDSIQPEDILELRRDMQEDGGALAFSWGLLVLRTLGEEEESSFAHLFEIQGSNGDWNDNPYTTALAIMAIRGYL